MRNLRVSPSRIGGKITLPPSKSYTQRALICALLANGTSTIHNPLNSPDISAMICAIEKLGARCTQLENHILVKGGLQIAPCSIDAGNSGIVYRFITALASLGSSKVSISGDHSIQTSRPILPLLDALNQLGVSTTCNPVSVCGPWTANEVTIHGADSQPVSALLFAATQRKHTTIHVMNEGEKPWIELTLHWLSKVGIYWRRLETGYLIEGGEISPFEVTIPPDMSSLAFPLVGAALSEQTLEFGPIDPLQGDHVVIEWIKSGILKRGGTLDINSAIDALPITAVAGCFGKSPLELINGAIARKKECDRIKVMCRELKKMGATIEEKEDGMVVHPSQLSGCELRCDNDHRIAMALSIAALNAKGTSRILGAGCIEKTYHTFAEDLQQIGGDIFWE